MWVVTLDALPPRLFPEACIPVSVRAAVRAVLPVSEDGPMAFGAESLRLIPGNFAPAVIDKRVPVGRVMAIEATRVETVLQVDLFVLRHCAVSVQWWRRNDRVAISAAVRKDRDVILRFKLGAANRSRVGDPRRYLRRVDDRTDERQGIEYQEDGEGKQNARHPIGRPEFQIV